MIFGEYTLWLLVIALYASALFLFVRESRSGARENAAGTHDLTTTPTEAPVAATSTKSSEWLRVLPHVFRGDPEVIVTLVPDRATWQEVVHNGNTLGLIELPHTGARLGIQVLSPEVGEYINHSSMMHSAGYQMAKPVYIGPLSGMPQTAMMHTGMCPVIVLRHEMHRRFWNIKSWAFQQQIGRGAAN